MDRGEGLAREIPRDTREQPLTQLPKNFPHATNIAAKDDPKEIVGENDNYVLITGSLPTEQSKEKVLANGTSRGSMSYYLEMELKAATSDTTYRDLMSRVAADVSRDNPGQNPQVAGLTNKKIFDGSVSDSALPITVVAADAATATITAGQMSGVDRGALVAFYDPQQKYPNGKLGEGVVESADLSNSVVSFTPEKGLTVSPEQLGKAHAMILSPLFGDKPLQVVLPASDPVIDDLRKTISPSPTSKAPTLFSIANASSPTRPGDGSVIVRKTGFREAFCGGLPKTASKAECTQLLPPPSKTKCDGTPAPAEWMTTPADDAPVYYIAPAGGQPLFDRYVPASNPEASCKLLDWLTKFARQRNLLALENRESPLTRRLKDQPPPIEVQLIPVTCPSYTPEGRCVAKNGDPMPLSIRDVGYKLKTDFLYRLRIINHGDDELYITALDMSTNGAINVMYPMPGEQQSISPGNQVQTKLFRLSRPVGFESFKIIATTFKSDYSLFGQGNARSPAVSPLDSLMASVEDGFVSRGDKLPAASDSDHWAVLSPFTIKIMP